MRTAKLHFDVKEIVQKGRTTTTDVNCIRTWLDSTSFPRLSNGQIINFLIASNNHHEKTKKRIETHFSLKSKTTYFENRNVLKRDLVNIFDKVCFGALTKRLQNSAFMVVALKDPKLSNVSFRAVFKYLLMSFEGFLYEDPPDELSLIIDFKGVGFCKILSNLKLIRAFLNYTFHGFPLRLKKIYVLNGCWFWYLVLRSKCNFGNRDDFLRDVPTSYLPTEYDGFLGPIDQYHYDNFKKLKAMQPYFDAEMLQYWDG